MNDMTRTYRLYARERKWKEYIIFLKDTPWQKFEGMIPFKRKPVVSWLLRNKNNQDLQGHEWAGTSVVMLVIGKDKKVTIRETSF